MKRCQPAAVSRTDAASSHAFAVLRGTLPRTPALVVATVLGVIAVTFALIVVTSDSDRRQNEGCHDPRKGLAAGRQRSRSVDRALVTQLLERRCEALWRRKNAVWLERRGARVRSVPVGVGSFPTEAKLKKSRKRGTVPKSVWDWFEPEWVCDSEERFGNYLKRYESFGDGPKFVCGVDVVKRRDPCLVYSIGSNQDFQFEKSSKEIMGCEVHTFDPTIKGVFEGAAYSTLHAERLGKDNSLRDIMPRLGHEGRHIDILKWDCEGCEWETIPLILDDVIAGTFSIGQLQIEIHGPSSWFKSVPKILPIRELFSKMDSAGLRLFHKERNTYCTRQICMEYAFVSNAHARAAFNYTHCDVDAKQIGGR